MNNAKSIILGVISIALAFISFFVFWWFSIIGAVLGIIGLVLRDTRTSGKIVSGIGVGLSIILFIISLVVLF